MELETAMRDVLQALERLRSLIEAALANRDPLACHIASARRMFSLTADRDGKSGKRVALYVIHSYHIACELGYRGNERGWRSLLGAILPR